jgi:hypothetical protein
VNQLPSDVIEAVARLAGISVTTQLRLDLQLTSEIAWLSRQRMVALNASGVRASIRRVAKAAAELHEALVDLNEGGKVTLTAADSGQLSEYEKMAEVLSSAAAEAMEPAPNRAKRDSDQDEDWEPRDAAFALFLSRLLTDIARAGRELSFDKNNPKSDLDAVLVLLKPHLPPDFLRSRSTIQRIKTRWTKQHEKPTKKQPLSFDS